ncbi:MAG: hypothetical protein AMXMBFR47_16620 [Planctomycetota bacterium]
MAELADARDSKSRAPQRRVGSIPTSGNVISSSQPEPGALRAPADTGRDQPACLMSRGRFVVLAALILLATGALRYAIGTRMPVIAKDGVGYCWNARALGAEGAAALQREDFNQHPLFPLSILGVERVLTQLGARPSPETWQHAGRIVAFGSGLPGVILIGWLAHRVARGAAPGRCCRRVSLWAMVIAGLLPLNTALSVDVLSEPLFFVPYLAGAALMVDWRIERRVLTVALIVGVCAGLAFLVRPEGAAIGLGAAAVLLRQTPRFRILRLAGAGAALAAGFLICALPYWAALGKFSPKESKQEIREFRPAAVRPGAGQLGGPLLLAATEYEVYGVGTALLEAARETFRAGRVVVVLLALIALAAWRRKLLGTTLVGIGVVATVHFGLCVVLLLRHGYLDQRHTLAVVLLLIPAAAATLDWLIAASRVRGRAAWGGVAAVGLLSPLAVYSLRVPHHDEGYLREAAAEIVAEAEHEHEPVWVTGRAPGLVLGGSSIRRVAFYADATYAGYFENAATLDERFADLRWRLVADPPVADWFAIEAAAVCEDVSNELEANRALLDRLFADAEVAGALANRLPPMEMRGGAALHVFRLARRPGAAAGPVATAPASGDAGGGGP